MFSRILGVSAVMLGLAAVSPSQPIDHIEARHIAVGATQLNYALHQRGYVFAYEENSTRGIKWLF